MPCGGESEDTAMTRVSLDPNERSAALTSRRVLSAAWLHDDGDGIGDVGDLRLGLPDAYRLDHDNIECCCERVRCCTGRPRQDA
jgi:hypothetical protein